jgi:hypothetical protein
MADSVPEKLLRHRHWVGAAAVLLSILTWAVDLGGLVYECPYCRVQRTVIGLLGLLFLTPNPGHWLIRYLAAVIAVFGLAVGAAQHFRGWQRIMAGEFEWGEDWYVNPWMLSGFALFIITGLTLLIWSYRTSRGR